MPTQIQLEDASGYPVIGFKPTNDTYNVCSFQDKLNFANTGVSAAYKALFTPVPKISDDTNTDLVISRYRAYDPERNTSGNVYNSKEPLPDPNWFSNLNPYDPVTKKYNIDSGITAESNRIEKKYYPNGVPSPHPAFDPYFDKFGGSRSENIVSFVDIDPTIPPFMNMYFHMKKISDDIKASGEGFVEKVLPVGVESFISSTKKLKTIPPTTINL